MGKQVAAGSITRRAHSLAGKSARLISVRSVVRIHLSPLDAEGSHCNINNEDMNSKNNEKAGRIG